MVYVMRGHFSPPYIHSFPSCIESWYSNHFQSVTKVLKTMSNFLADVGACGKKEDGRTLSAHCEGSIASMGPDMTSF